MALLVRSAVLQKTQRLFWTRTLEQLILKLKDNEFRIDFIDSPNFSRFYCNSTAQMKILAQATSLAIIVSESLLHFL